MGPGWPRINRSICFALGTLMLSMTLGCQHQSARGVALEDLKASEARPLFWRVQGDRGADLYILSSPDAGGPAGGWSYPPAIEQAFESAQALVVELDPSEMTADQTQALVATYGTLPRGLSLQKELPSDLWTKLAPQLKRAELPISYADQMQPWLVQLLLQAEAMRRLGLSSRNGVDEGFIEEVGDRSIIGLESIKFQIALLVRMPIKVQSASLRHSLTHFENFEDEVESLVKAWRRGDEQLLARLLSLDGSADPSEKTFLELFTFRRSQSMAEQLGVLLEAEQHRGERVFVVMGIQYLVGQEGIPALLQEKGYAVKRYSPSALLHALPGG